jgi:hypothetical protein
MARVGGLCVPLTIDPGCTSSPYLSLFRVACTFKLTCFSQNFGGFLVEYSAPVMREGRENGKRGAVEELSEKTGTGKGRGWMKNDDQK